MKHKFVIATAALLLAALCWLLVIVIRDRRPYSVAQTALSGWKIVVGPPGGTAVVAMQPPGELSTNLFRQVASRRKELLVAAEQPLVPLVVQDEYADSLQGVLSVDDIIEVARGAGLDAARFDPVCLAERRESRNGRVEELLYVMFEAPAFADFRQQLTPLFPEHAGSVAFEPGALHLMMPLATTDRELARQSAATIQRQAECVARISLE